MIQVSLFVPDLLDAWGNLTAFLDKVKAAGCHRLHFLAFRASPGGCHVEQSAAKPSGRCTMPWGIVGEHTRENGSKFPLYRLTNNWNVSYFDRLIFVLREMKRRGIVAEVSAEDIRLRSGDDKYWNPFYCSEEALGSHTPGGVWGEPGKRGMMNYHRNWMRILVRKVLAIQPRALFEPDNEFNTPSFAHVPGDAFDLYLVNDCRPALASYLMDAGVYPQKIWTSGDLRNWREGCAYYSAHGIVRPEDVKPFYKVDNVPNSRLIVSMDGGFDGDGDADIAGRKGASVEQTIGIVENAQERKMRKVEVMARKMWRRNKHVAHLDDFDPSTLSAAVEAGK